MTQEPEVQPQRKWPEEPPIDWSRIDLPSDQISVKKMCLVEGFLTNPHFGGRVIDLSRTVIHSILDAERQVAFRAYRKAAGTHDLSRPPDLTRRDWVQELNRDYQIYGITTGMQMTNQLVRQLEESAARQAREHLGKAP